MEIGPIVAIRPVSMVRPSPSGSDSGPDLPGVFAVEFRGQQREDSYTPSRQPDRGLEDEEEEEEGGSASAGSAEASVSFFA
jgi:hypothetical protein